MPDNPSTKYVEIVKEALKGNSLFTDKEELLELLAYSCHRNNWPLDKKVFDESDIQFSEDDSTKLSSWVDIVVKTFEDEATLIDKIKGDDMPDDVMHYHGEFKHSHANGGKSHTHEEHPGEYKMMDKETKDPPKKDTPPASMSEVAKSLGLAEDADQNSIVSAIAELKTSSFTAQEKASFEEMRANHRLSHWSTQTETQTMAPGTTTERAQKLTDVEKKYGEDAAKERLEEFANLHNYAEEAGITRTMLKARATDNEDGPVTKKIQTFADEKKVTFNEALAQMVTAEPGVLGEYRKEKES